MDESKKDRKVRNLLIDKPFQLKYTLAIVVISTLISTILGFFLYRAQQEVFETSRVNSQLIALDDPEIDSELQSELAKKDQEIQTRNHKVLLTLVLMLGGLVLALTLLGIVATHKIAGPAYALRRVMSLIADGKHPYVRALRRGDELRAVAEELKRMADNLRTREENELAELKQAFDSITPEADVPEQVITCFKKLITKKERRLNS